MKKHYISPKVEFTRIDLQDIICASRFGPNSEGIGFGGEEGDEEIYRPSSSRRMWEEWERN